MMAKKPKNEAGAKALLKFLGSAKAAENLPRRSDPTTSRRTRRRTPAKYTALQKKAAELIASAKNIAQFLDRDTGPTSPPR